MAEIVCIGEVLWDVLPRGRFLGGAPFNVAAHLARLGSRTTLITRVGDDESGRAAIAAATAHGIDTALVQIDSRHPTGEARATIDANGSATYSFPEPSAWDAIEATPTGLARVGDAAAVVFGTLAQRAPTSRESVLALARAARFRVFDPNLRSPHVDREIALASLALADFVKFNEDECAIFGDWLGCGPEPQALQGELERRFGVSRLCITQGAAGSLLWIGGRWLAQPATRVTVADTVGAGDSFLAMLVGDLLADRPPEVALAKASRLAGLVASRAGAVPAYSPDELS